MPALPKPVHVFVGRQELIGYTELSLTRRKEDMTGTLSITLFMGYMPNEAVLDGVIRGQEILVYVGQQLAFTGTIDRRTDTGTYSGGEPVRNPDGTFASGDSGGPTLNIGPDEYTVTITARGKTKSLIDGANQMPPCVLDVTNREAIQQLIDPFNITLDWRAQEVDLPRVRFRNGSRVWSEIQRLAQTTAIYLYEGVDGRLVAVDEPESDLGEPIVLGQNILTFETDQIGDQERSEFTVEGRLNEPGDFGEAAIIPIVNRVADAAAQGFAPVKVQIYGNATEAIRERAALFEANQQATQTKRITVEVFHVTQTDGTPWDIGRVHALSIPPAGVGGAFEIVEVNYRVEAERVFKTLLTLAPTPVTPTVGDAQILADISIPALSGLAADLGGLRASWLGATLTELSTVVETTTDGLLQGVEDTINRLPPLRLPVGFQDGLDDE